jgi:hypothetical protein
MRKVEKSWMAVVAAVLLLGTLAGVVWARPGGRPQAAEITRKVTLPAGALVSTSKAYDWGNDGAKIWCNSGTCYWAAHVVFPCLPAVTVERVKLHVYDFNTGDRACAEVYRSRPAAGQVPKLGGVCSPITGTTLDPETFASGAINKVVWPSQGAVAWLVSGSNIWVYGITVEYHRNI